jgi:hypothetical protein
VKYLNQRIATCAAIAGRGHSACINELYNNVERLEEFTFHRLGETPDAYAALDLVGKYAESVASALRGRPSVVLHQHEAQEVRPFWESPTVGDLVNGVVEPAMPASPSIDLGDLIDSVLSLVELFESFGLPAQEVPAQEPPTVAQGAPAADDLAGL